MYERVTNLIEAPRIFRTPMAFTARLRLAALATALAIGASASLAGNEDPSASRRWVIGSQVNLRAQPAPGAEVLRRLAVDSEVDLLATLPGGKYCEVAVTANGEVVLRGFTACQYLGTEPLAPRRIAQQLLENGERNPHFNPRQAFWLAPSYEALNAYGEYLEETRLSPEQRAEGTHPRLRDAEFERMKAHLAQGIFGPPSRPYPAWEDLQRAAAKAADQSNRLQTVLGTYDIDTAKVPGLIKAIELPGIRASLFKHMDEIAPPAELAEQVSGRFRIVHTIQTRGREVGQGDEKSIVPGTWDVGQVIKSLTRPVTRNVVFRDGRIAAAPTNLKRAFIEWSDSDGPMCDGYQDGYSFGDSDPKIWIGYGIGEEAYKQSLKSHPKNSLMYFHTRSPLPGTKAVVRSDRQKLDRAATGFVAATRFTFDLDADGIVDLAVWEGTGRAQGHLDGAPSTDDAYQRIFFANIGGRWHVLGSDRFGYGCGC